MSNMNGVDLIIEARKHGYHGAAFLMTGDPDSLNTYLAERGLTREEFFSGKYCNSLITKPFDIHEVVKMLQAYKPQ